MFQVTRTVRVVLQCDTQEQALELSRRLSVSVLDDDLDEMVPEGEGTLQPLVVEQVETPGFKAFGFEVLSDIILEGGK